MRTPCSLGWLFGSRIGRPVMRTDLLRPRRLDERLGDDQLSGDAIDRVEEPVPVREHHHLAVLAVDRQLAQDRHLRRVPVVHVVRRELVVPLQLAGVGIERHDRGGEQVVAFAIGAVVIRPRIAGAEEHQVLFGIVGARDPDRAAAARIRIGLGPGVAANLARAGHGVEAPDLLAGRGVEGLDEAANAELGAGDAQNHLVFDHQRRHGGRVAALVVFERHVEQHGAGLHVERHQVRIERRHVQPIAQHTKAAIDRTATQNHLVRQFTPVSPDLAAGSRVDGPRVIVDAGDVQHTVDHNRGRLKGAKRTGLKRPLRCQLMDVGRRDLRQRTMPLTIVGAGVGEPLARVLESGSDVLRR